jgi:hypothetical protein
MMDVAVAEALGWKRYRATRRGQPIVVLAGDTQTLYDCFTLSQGEQWWQETTDPLTAGGARLVPCFSTDIAAAWPLAEQFGLVVGPTYQTHPQAPKWRACKGWQEGLQEVSVEAMTAPEAICLAVLVLRGRG